MPAISRILLIVLGLLCLSMLSGCSCEPGLSSGLEIQWLASEVIRDTSPNFDSYPSDLHTIRIINNAHDSRTVVLRYDAHRGPFYMVVQGDTVNLWLNNGEEEREVPAKDSITFFIRTDRMPYEFDSLASSKNWNPARLFFWPDDNKYKVLLDSVEILKISSFYQGICLPEGNFFYKDVLESVRKGRR